MGSDKRGPTTTLLNYKKEEALKKAMHINTYKHTCIYIHTYIEIMPHGKANDSITQLLAK